MEDVAADGDGLDFFDDEVEVFVANGADGLGGRVHAFAAALPPPTRAPLSRRDLFLFLIFDPGNVGSGGEFRK